MIVGSITGDGSKIVCWRYTLKVKLWIKWWPGSFVPGAPDSIARQEAWGTVFLAAGSQSEGGSGWPGVHVMPVKIRRRCVIKM